MSTIEDVRRIILDILQLQSSPEEINEDTVLLGGIPEFDSMAVVSLITGLEDYYGFEVDDDEIDADTFETVGSLVAFVDSKL